MLTPPKSPGSPLMVKNLKSCWIVDFDSSKEGSWCTECNAKNHTSLQSTDSEEIRKNSQSCALFFKLRNFGSFSKFLETLFFCREPSFFALHLVHQDPSFELSKSTIQKKFHFHHKGGISVCLVANLIAIITWSINCSTLWGHCWPDVVTEHGDPGLLGCHLLEAQVDRQGHPW